MINKPDYFRATNAAYNTLLTFGNGSPQIDIIKVLNMMPNVKVHTYTELMKKFLVSNNELCDLAQSNFGCFIYGKNTFRKEVWYNDWKDERTCRFTLAHELGHIVLGHLEDGNIENKEADCFARNLLCPVPIADRYGLKTIEDYQLSFRVNVPVAEIAIKLKGSDSYYITVHNYNEINIKLMQHLLTPQTT